MLMYTKIRSSLYGKNIPEKSIDYFMGLIKLYPVLKLEVDGVNLKLLIQYTRDCGEVDVRYKHPLVANILVYFLIKKATLLLEPIIKLDFSETRRYNTMCKLFRCAKEGVFDFEYSLVEFGNILNYNYLDFTLVRLDDESDQL